MSRCASCSKTKYVESVSIYTPNMHMIPFMALKQLGRTHSGTEALSFEDDVYVATSDPAGTIHCTVSR